MINFDDYTNENKTKHNPKWPYIPDHLYKILIIRGSGSGKTNALLNSIKGKDPYEAKYQYLINKREKVDSKHYDDHKAFIEYLNDMQDFYRNTEEYNLEKKHKVLIVFDDMIADMSDNKKT